MGADRGSGENEKVVEPVGLNRAIGHRAKWPAENERGNFEYHCERVLEGLLYRRLVVQNAIERIEAILPIVKGGPTVPANAAGVAVVTGAAHPNQRGTIVPLIEGKA